MATKPAHLRSVHMLSTWSAALPLDGFVANPLASYRAGKRLFDIVLAALLLVLLAPLLALIALAVVLDSPGPALFVQRRVLGDRSLGQGRRQPTTFAFIKFRTMVHHADQSVHQEYMRRLIEGTAGKNGSLFKIERDPRVTRVGRFLRKTSLDELPQLLNIIRGEMSFVGPRPAIPYEVAHYRPHYYERLTVPQGLTGLWQTMGRCELDFEEMVALDIRYVRTRSFLGDLRILAATIPQVLFGRGAC